MNESSTKKQRPITAVLAPTTDVLRDHGNRSSRYSVVMRLVWRAAEGPPRNWRSIAKALVLIDHLLKHGAEKVVSDVQQHVHDIRTLTEFSYLEGSLDRGHGGTCPAIAEDACLLPWSYHVRGS